MLIPVWRGAVCQRGLSRGFHFSACRLGPNDAAKKKVKKKRENLPLEWARHHAWRKELEAKFEDIKDRPVIHWKGPEPLQVWMVDLHNQPLSIVTLNPRVWGCPLRSDIVHRVVRWQRAGWRCANHHTKLRNEVRGGGKKPRKQKGTGRARLGSIRSPLMSGGGVALGPRRERDFSFDLPAKVVNAGKCIALSAKFKEGNLIVLKDTMLPTHRTADLRTLAEQSFPAIHQGQIAVVHGGELDPNFALAARNLYNWDFYTPDSLTTFEIVKRHHLIVTEAGLAALEAYLMKLIHNDKITFPVDRPIVKLEGLPRYPVFKGNEKQVNARKRLADKHLIEQGRALRQHAYS
jgi:large subunit ribosomal protein L4